MKQPSVLEWYRVLRRAHHLFTIFQAIRYALWLARYVPFARRSSLRKRLHAVASRRPAILILKRSETWMHSRLSVEVILQTGNSGQQIRVQ